MQFKLNVLFIAVPLVLALAGCGSDDTPAVASTALSGQVVKGPVGGSTVCVYAVSGGVRATAPLTPCVTSDATGNYTFASFTYSGDVVVEATGGTYKNEATGITTPLTAPLSTVIAVNGGNLAGLVTPLTTVAVATSGSLSSAAFNTAASNVAAQAGLGSTNITTTVPTFNTGSTGTITATNAYAAVLASIAQYQASNGNVTLATVLNSWGNNTANFQAALQVALNTYAANAGVLSSNLPAAYNLTATGATSVTVSGNGTTSTGGLVSSSSLTLTGAGAGFQPIAGVGVSVSNTGGVINFVSATVSFLGVAIDSGGASVLFGDQAGNEWAYECNGAACNGKIDYSFSGKTVTFTNVTLTPDSPSATGNIVVNGSATFQ
jgi:hypothetical protein